MILRWYTTLNILFYPSRPTRTLVKHIYFSDRTTRYIGNNIIQNYSFSIEQFCFDIMFASLNTVFHHSRVLFYLCKENDFFHVTSAVSKSSSGTFTPFNCRILILYLDKNRLEFFKGGFWFIFGNRKGMNLRNLLNILLKFFPAVHEK